MDDIDISAAALFLDFDGTLAPIVALPDMATLAPETRAALMRLSELAGGAVAIVSGRALDDLDTRLAPAVLPAAGSHGAERRDAAGQLHATGAGSASLERAAAGLAEFAAEHGLVLEHKPGSVALHYRSHPEIAPAAREAVEAAVGGDPALRAIHGHMVAEAALAEVNKGAAVRAFMTEPPFRGRVAVAVGDDTTDEDAIATAQDLGGIGVRIGPGPTAARIRLPSIGAFLDWLHGKAGATS